jgi:putative copper export protein
VDISGWDIAAALAKAICYGGTLGAAGAAFFLSYCPPPARAARHREVRRLIAALVAVAAAASMAKILLLAGSMSDNSAGMFDREYLSMILNAGEGRATGWRFVGLALMAWGVFTAGPGRIIGLVGGMAAATSFAWIGHVHALLPHWLPSLLLCIHLLCAAFWWGALAPLLMLANSGDTQLIAAAAARFGKIALAAVALLVAAGAAILSTLLDNVSELWLSAYGRMVSAKMLLVALLVLLAAINKLRLTPRLMQGDAGARSALRNSLRAELTVGSCILLLTAAFTSWVGPAS